MGVALLALCTGFTSYYIPKNEIFDIIVFTMSVIYAGIGIVAIWFGLKK